MWEPELDELQHRRELAARMGGEERVARHRAAGKLTVRERIDALVDPGSWQEVGATAGHARYGEDGRLDSLVPANFLCGTGRIDGRKVVVGADDFTVRAGSADAAIVGKQVWSERAANELRLPLVRLIDGQSGGGSVKLLERAGHSYVPVNPAWDLVVDNLSVVPVVAVGLGSIAGLGAARLTMAHLTVLVEGIAQLFVAGPPLVRGAMRQNLTKDELGGSHVHRTSGAVDLVVATEEEAFAAVRSFLSYLPPNIDTLPPVTPCDDPYDRADESLLSAIPRNRRQPHRIRTILTSVFDAGSVFEPCRFGGGTVTALARLDGHPVGVVTTDPFRDGGGMTALGADALTRFVDLCSTFHLPIVALTDQPGIAIGLEAERQGTIRRAVRAVTAVYQASVPMAEVILRRVFGVGGAGFVNRHKHVTRWAWPSGDWGSLPVEGGLEAAYRRELEAADDPEALREQIRARLDAVRSPLRSAERFGVEDIIDPRDTRRLLCEWVHDAYALLPRTTGPPSFGTRP